MGVVDVAPLISDLATGDVTIWRAAAPARNAIGEYVDQPRTAIATGPAVVHTVSGRTYDQPADSDRTRERVEMYVYSRVYVSEGAQAADILEYSGGGETRYYRAIGSNDYQIQGDVWFAVCERMSPQEVPPL